MKSEKRPGYKKPPGYDPSLYSKPSVACDVVIFTWRKSRLMVLLIKRKRLPYKGCWATPGGFLDINEPLEKAAARELKEETGVSGLELEEFGAFGDPDRDPRTRVISVAYLALAPFGLIKPRAGDDAAAAKWFPVNRLPELAFDHDLVLEKAMLRLKERLLTSPSIFNLLPHEFEIKELKELLQAVTGKKFPIRSFREKILATGMLKETRSGLYRFFPSRFKPGTFHFLFE